MLYRQITENCFQSSVGPIGLAPDAFGRCLSRAGEALDWLRGAYQSGELPLLQMPWRRDEIPAMQELANTLRETFSHIVVLGTGGSSLGGRALVALAHPSVQERVLFPDNLDGETYALLLQRLDLKRTCFIVISKSGGTAETLAQALVALGAVRDAVGETALKARFLVIVQPGDSPLRRLAGRWSLSTMDHDPNLGGRYSVLSLVGLLPAMAAGVDGGAVREGAGEILEATMAAAEPGAAAAAVGAAISVAAFQQGLNNSVLMPYCDGLASFALWHRQLWAESLGKAGQGSLPVPAIGPVDQHSQLQLYLDGPPDKLFTLILRDDAGSGSAIPVDLAGHDPALAYLRGRTIGDLVAAEGRATAETLAQHGRPLREFHLRRLDEATMGALMMHFMLETIIAAHLLEVDPFDQPAVEEGKVLARKYLSDMALEEQTQ